MDDSTIDEDLAIKAVIEAAALDYGVRDYKNRYTWKREGYTKTNRTSGNFLSVSQASKRDYKSLVEARTPPAGYLCLRCRMPGHLIQHCPTNGDPNYDFKGMKPATGISKSMSNRKAVMLQPNEAEFEKMVDCLPTKHVVDIPKELHCPLCNRVMQDAALTSKCCFKSYCDKCIRDYTISRDKCACGARSKVDALVPNVTVRSTIARYLSLSNGSSTPPNEVRSTNNAKPKSHSPQNVKNKENIEAKATDMPETTAKLVKEPLAVKKSKKRKLTQTTMNAGIQSVNCMMPYQWFGYYSYMPSPGVGNMMPIVSQSELSKDWVANNKGNGATKAKLASHLFIIIYLNISAHVFIYNYLSECILIVFNMNMMSLVGFYPLFYLFIYLK